MEDLIDTQLHEVDSLPDGFVDSTAEPTGPPTPIIELEKLLSDLRGDSRSRSTCWNDSTLGSDAGILLCAKTKIAKFRLSTYFADGVSLISVTRNTRMEPKPARKITKFYLVLVKGIIGEDELIISQPIGVAEYSGVAKGLYVAPPSGKPAVSKVKVLKRDVERYRMIVQVKMQSRRPHQIHIHLSFVGHPLICDPLYVEGGKPRGFTFDDADESFALDGYFAKLQGYETKLLGLVSLIQQIFRNRMKNTRARRA